MAIYWKIVKVCHPISEAMAEADPAEVFRGRHVARRRSNGYSLTGDENFNVATSCGTAQQRAEEFYFKTFKNRRIVR